MGYLNVMVSWWRTSLEWRWLLLAGCDMMMVMLHLLLLLLLLLLFYLLLLHHVLLPRRHIAGSNRGTRRI